jgi:hypothetical protein
MNELGGWKFGQSRSFSSTFDRYRGVLACVSGFFDHPIDKRIACPYKFSKHWEQDSGRKIWAALFARQHALLWRVAAIVPVAR